jgi:hypothetical protein
MTLETSKRRFRKRSSVVDRRIGQEYVIIPIRRSIDDPAGIFHLNETGAFMWKRLVEGRSMAEVAVEVRDSFDVELGTAEEDLIEFVATLERIEALEPCDAVDD